MLAAAPQPARHASHKLPQEAALLVGTDLPIRLQELRRTLPEVVQGEEVAFPDMESISRGGGVDIFPTGNGRSRLFPVWSRFPAVAE